MAMAMLNTSLIFDGMEFWTEKAQSFTLLTAHTSFRLLQGILKEIPCQSFATSKLYHVFHPVQLIFLNSE